MSRQAKHPTRQEAAGTPHATFFSNLAASPHVSQPLSSDTPALHQEARYAIRDVVALTGVSASTLRFWEERYRLLTPARTKGGMRLYRDADVRRARQIKALSKVQHLSLGAVAALVARDEETPLSQSDIPPLQHAWQAPSRSSPPEAPRPMLTTTVPLAIGDGMNLTQTLDVICRDAAATFAVDCAQIWLIERRKAEGTGALWLEFGASACSTASSRASMRVELEGDGVLAQMLRERRGRYLHNLKDVVSDPDIASLCAGAEAALLLPLAVEDQVLGLVALLDAQTPDRFTDADLNQTQIIAGYIALTVHHAQLLQRAQARAAAYDRGLHAVARTAEVITSSLQLGVVTEQIVSVIRNLLGVHSAWVMVYDEEADALRLEAINGWDLPIGMEIPIKQSVAGKIFLTGHSLFIPDVQAEPLFATKEAAAEVGVVAMLGMPLMSQGRVVGVLGLNPIPDQQGVVSNPLEGPDSEWLSVFANQAGVAVQNAQLYDRLQTEHAFTEHMAQTEQRRAREMETIFESMAEGVIVFDADGQVVRVNRACAALAGISPDQVANHSPLALGRHVVERLAGQNLDLTRHPLVVRALAGEVVTGEKLALTRGQEASVYLEVSVAPLYGEEGQSTGAVAILEDITEQHQRQREQLAVGWVAAALNYPLDLKETLDTAVEALTAALGADHSAILLADTEHDVLNTAVARGYSEEITSFAALPTDAPLVPCRAFRTRKVQISSGDAFVDASGQPLLPFLAQEGVQASLAAPLIVQDQALGVLVYSYTQPHQFSSSEQQVARAIADQIGLAVVNARLYEAVADYVVWQENERAMLQAIIDELPAGVILRDQDGTLFMYNEAALNLAINCSAVRAARAAGEFSMSPVWEVVGPEGEPPEQESLPSQQAILTGQPVKGIQVFLRQADGRIVPTLVNAAPVRDEGGNLTRGVSVFQDITALKELERHKDEFISVASHELRGPLTVIRGQAQLLQRQLRRQEKQGQLQPSMLNIMESMENIESQTARLNDLVNDLMDVSRIQSGKLVLQRMPTEVQPLIARVVQHWARSSANHTLLVDADLPAEHVLGWWDARRVEQIFNNLIGNAMKYSPEGGNVQVRVRHHAEAGEVVVTVQDGGMGIPPEALEHLFERFYRAGNVHSISGTGLGLYISKQLAVAHGGDVWAESPGPGKGSTFSLRLPLS